MGKVQEKHPIRSYLRECNVVKKVSVFYFSLQIGEKNGCGVHPLLPAFKRKNPPFFFCFPLQRR